MIWMALCPKEYYLRSMTFRGRMIMFQLTGQATPLAKAILRKVEKLKPQDIIGSGGYGTVYKLVLDDLSAFAVKKLTRGVLERDQGFERELQTLIDISHRNLLTLRGYYSAPQINIFIYDLMRNVNLDFVLHEHASRNEDPINWGLRLRIALGVARGLSCLHYDCVPHIIHRDIECSNILLDEYMEAHVGDFGLAKFVSPEKTHVTTMAAGTFRYLPPGFDFFFYLDMSKYLETGKITEKGDVYGFVVLLELLTGKRPNDDDFRDYNFIIVQWVSDSDSSKILTNSSMGLHSTVQSIDIDGPQRNSPTAAPAAIVWPQCGEQNVLAANTPSLEMDTSSPDHTWKL
uniref:Protein kinase domain-containing protein n=1 Tax=Physcomitrium patens TaxID=3218 RepID=A0A7I4ALU4_PHYPA